MTDEQAIKLYEDMSRQFGDMLPNFEHHPIQFVYYYKLYKLIQKNAKPI